MNFGKVLRFYIPGLSLVRDDTKERLDVHNKEPLCTTLAHCFLNNSLHSNDARQEDDLTKDYAQASLKGKMHEALLGAELKGGNSNAIIIR